VLKNNSLLCISVCTEWTFVTLTEHLVLWRQWIIRGYGGPDTYTASQTHIPLSLRFLVDISLGKLELRRQRNNLKENINTILVS